MAGSIGFLIGLIDLPTISFQSGIPISTLQKYARGDFKPSAQRLVGLQKIYSNVQTIRLRMAGLPTREARRLSVSSRRKVDQFIRDTASTVSKLAKGNDVPETAIIEHMQQSEKTAEELWY